MQSENLKQRIALAAAGAMPSLCVIEELGQMARKMQPDLISDPEILNARMADKVARCNQ